MKVKILLAFLFLSQTVLAGNNFFTVGARSYGIGQMNSFISDGYAVFHQPAGLANTTSIQFVSYFDHKYNQWGLSSGAAGLVFPFLQNGGLGLGFFRFGDALYNETRVSAGYGHQIGFMKLGLGVDYLSLTIAEVGNKSNVALNLGGVANLTPKLFFGAIVMNLNRAWLQKEQQERVPTVMKAGLGYQPFPRLLLGVEVEKEGVFPVNVKGGIEYGIVPWLYLRTGVMSVPFTGYFGVGLHFQDKRLDYAFSRHPVLGFTHHLSFSLVLPQFFKK